ncbi:MAG: hypothetical protein RLY32_815 [Pseudomonadota bacterium]
MFQRQETALSRKGPAFGPFLLLALLALCAQFRPILPVDETRYLGVAWEMWLRGDQLVPYQNGAPYAHKPPLLFWLIQLGWWLFGPQEIWPRLLPSLFAAGHLLFSFLVIGRLLQWDSTLGSRREADVDRPGSASSLTHGQSLADASLWILSGSLLWTYFATGIMFDMMLSMFVAMAWYGLFESGWAWFERRERGRMLKAFGWFAIGLLGALMSKGPVALLHIMPLALGLPFLLRSKQASMIWWLSLLFACLTACSIMLGWALAAANAGGEVYAKAILWGQTAGRVVKSFAHRAPLWFYLASMPVMFAPWLFWPRLWIGLWHSVAGLRHAGLVESFARSRLLAGTLLLGLLTPLLVLSSVSGKQMQYLLPEFTWIALLIAGALAIRDSGKETAHRWHDLLPIICACGLILFLPFASQMHWLEHHEEPEWPLILACAAALLAYGLAVQWIRLRGGISVAIPAIAVASALSSASIGLGMTGLMGPAWDMGPASQAVSSWQQAGRPLAWLGYYHGQFHWKGRLQSPLIVVKADQAERWLEENPNGILLLAADPNPPAGPWAEIARYPFRGQFIVALAHQAATRN